MRHADLFAGMGGMTLALHGTSAPALYCEIDSTAIAFLRREIASGQLPEAPIVKDVLDVASLCEHGPVDIVTAGFPCVGFSAVGLKDGLADQRSGLFGAAVTAAAALQASHVFLENVPEVLSHRDDFRTICETVAEAGFTRVRWTVVSAADVGAPHLRRRWFCLCSRPGVDLANFMDMLTLPGWTPERCPRPVSSGPRDDATIRLLGNSLVPQAARAALQYLAAERQLFAVNGVPKHGAYAAGTFSEMSPPEFPAHRRHRITLEPAHYCDGALSRRLSSGSPIIASPVTRSRWPTPRAGPPSHSHILTDRATWDLSSAARFCSEIDGVPQPKTSNMDRLSVDFVTYLMRGDYHHS